MLLEPSNGVEMDGSCCMQGGDEKWIWNFSRKTWT